MVFSVEVFSSGLVDGVMLLSLFWVLILIVGKYFNFFYLKLVITCVIV